MSIGALFRTPRIRRGLAASAVVLAVGGLVLVRADAHPSVPRAPFGGVTNPFTGSTNTGTNAVTFKGPSLSGTFALGNTKVLAGGRRELFAELRLKGENDGRAKERAPLALAVVIDTSGSMEGEKIEQAKDSIVRLVRDMRDDDEIALVRYSDDSSTVQSLARVGDVRARLVDKIRDLRASGGTAIPLGLAHGIGALTEAGAGRVRRVILVSDGLDSSRAESERLAKVTFGRGITVSSLGIGLDFDEHYMSGVSESGHGNFAFVKDGATLARFLTKELEETAGTVVENTKVRVKLPAGVRFVRANGADAEATGDGELLVRVGSLFAGDERRVLLQLETDLDVGQMRSIDATASWNVVGRDAANVDVPQLKIAAVTDASEVEASRDVTVLASATSVRASERQVEASEAYARGDVRKAEALSAESVAELKRVAQAAPKPIADALAKQGASYDKDSAQFRAVAPSSAAGKAAAKSAVQMNKSNLTRNADFE
ncbi:MAG: VWA domain-containing protein [Polyangiaceae bacterium]